MPKPTAQRVLGRVDSARLVANLLQKAILVASHDFKDDGDSSVRSTPANSPTVPSSMYKMELDTKKNTCITCNHPDGSLPQSSTV